MRLGPVVESPSLANDFETWCARHDLGPEEIGAWEHFQSSRRADLLG